MKGKGKLTIFGCGYLGSAIAETALARGLDVTALTRNPDAAAALAARGIAAIVGDLASDSWHARVPACELAVNCVSAGGGGAAGYRKSYLEGMRSIAAWAGIHPVETIVYTSSTSVYPATAGERVDESAPVGGRDENSAVLVEAENALLAADVGFGRRFILRLAGLYGPGRTHLVDQVRSGLVSGEPERRLNLVQRDDAASAVWAALGAPPSVRGGIFNVSDGAPGTRREVARWIAGLLHLPLPEFSGSPAGGRGALTPDRVIRSDRIRVELNWTPAYPTYREGYAAVLR